jgi:hypothetical protein
MCSVSLVVALLSSLAFMVPGAARANYASVSGTALSAPNSVWNQPLASGAALAGNSRTLASALSRDVSVYGPNIETSAYSVPVYTVPASQPMVTVWLWPSNAQPESQLALQLQFIRAPIPPDARPADGTDQNLVVWQPSTDTMWEFWITNKDAGGVWHAKWGGRIDKVSHSPGYLPAPYGAAASGLVEAGGLMTLQEETDGVIRHALALALPNPSSQFVFPAQKTDGTNTSPGAIPEGTRFRLPASLNIAALHLPRQTAMMAVAAQQYGIIVRDTASTSVTFYAEDPHQYIQHYGFDPYGPYLFQGQYPSNLLASFPWSYLQVVHP